MGMLWARLPIIVLDLFQVRCASCKNGKIFYTIFLAEQSNSQKFSMCLCRISERISGYAVLQVHPRPSRKLEWQHSAILASNLRTRQNPHAIYWTRLTSLHKSPKNSDFFYIYLPKKRPVSGAIQLEALSLALVGPIHLSEEIIQASDNII